MQMVLNELSSTFPCETVEGGKQVMKTFLDTYFQAKEILRDDTILLDRNYQNVELAKGYPIAKWRNDKTIDTEVRRMFYRMINHSITFTSAEFGEEASWLISGEFKHCGKEAKGCLIAYERDDLVISFLSNPCWECEKLEGTYSLLDEYGEILEENEAVTVPHVSYNANLYAFKKDYSNKIALLGKTVLKSGKDILKNQAALFPNIVLCKNAVKQLEMDIGAEEVAQVYKKLLELQIYFGKTGDSFDKDALLNATPESDATLKRYGEDHTFVLPDGERILFTWHIRFTGSYAGRIFFYPDVAKKKCYIGHIGHKLPTMKYH